MEKHQSQALVLFFAKGKQLPNILFKFAT